MKKHFSCLLVLFLVVSASFVGVSNQKTFIDINKLQTPSDGGLMDSAWPMFHHDTRHTGRSPYSPSVGNFPMVKWRFQTDGLTVSSPAIDENGTIYIGAEDFHESFFAINPNGSERWRFEAGHWVDSSPGISSDGTIYFGSDNHFLQALYPNGSLKWMFDLSDWVFSSPTIGVDGTVYVGSFNNYLYAMNPNGTERWRFGTGDSILSSAAIDENGIIYFGSHDHFLYAVYPNGTLKWRYYTNDPIKSSPSIDDDGTVYVCSWDGSLYAIRPNGTLKWSFGTGDAAETSPAIAADGTVYVGSYNGLIFSVSPEGVENWRFQTGGEIYSSPAIDSNGIVYCGSDDGYLYALNPDGSLRWSFNAGDYIESSPVIGADGTIYIAGQFNAPDSYSYLYALQIVDSQPPSIPTINGPPSGRAGRTYEYTVMSTDPDGDDVSYYVDWGDGSNTGWIGPYVSGDEQTVSHVWQTKGTYTIRVKAKDDLGAESGWGSLRVTMPTKSNLIDSPFLNFLEQFFHRHPFSFLVFRLILDFN